MKRRDPINRYLYATRREAAARTARAEEEARYFVHTGEVQRLDRLFDVRDDERTTALRLACYQSWLARARGEGRYTGDTRLKRVLADGSTEPWPAGAREPARPPDGAEPEAAGSSASPPSVPPPRRGRPWGFQKVGALLLAWLGVTARPR